MAVQQLRQKLLVDGNLAILERRQFALVVIDQDDVVSKVRKTGACHQPDVSGAYDRDPHVLTPVMNCAKQLSFESLRRRSLGRIQKYGLGTLEQPLTRD